MTYFVALILGVVAGLRAFTAPAAASWAARGGLLHLGATPLAFLGYAWTPWIFTVLSFVEYVTDQLPSTPSRKVPMQFAPRLVSGAFCGAAVGLSGGSWIGGLLAGVIGAVVGTFAGAEGRARAAATLGRDRSAAIIEDMIAVAVAGFAVAMLT